MSSSARKSYTYGISAILLWSTIATAFALALDFVGIFQLMLGASIIAICSLLIILGFQGQLRELKKTTWKQLGFSAILGFLNPFLYYAVLLKAYTLLPAQEAMVLNYVWPITLVLLSIPILGQKIGWKSFICILISFSGVAVIATQGELHHFSFSNWKGDALALFSSIAWALYWLLNVKDSRADAQKLLVNFVFGAIYSAIAVWKFESFSLPVSKGVYAILYIGLFELGITFYLWLKGLSLAKSTDKISQLVFLSPFLSLLFISVFVGEKILPSTLIGLALIVLGILVQQSLSGRKKKKLADN